MSGQTASYTDGRLGGFDLVRVLAALGVVLLHASAPYMAHPLPGLVWSVSDSPSTVVDYIGWSIELFIMPLFLLIAGYFTPAVLARLTTWEFIKHRFRRLIVPLIVAMFIILPPDLYIWLTGWVIEERIPLRKMQSLKFDNGVDEGLWGLSHLWFLQYLFLYTVVYGLAARTRFWQFLASPEKPSQSKSVMMILTLAAISWAVLLCVPQVVFGFQHDFLPVPSKWIYSGLFFVAGLLLAHDSFLQQKLSCNWLSMLLVGGLMTIAGVTAGCQMLEAENSLTLRILATFLAISSAWLVSCGAVGWAMASRWPSSYWLRYLAAASFWVYLIHHPIVGLCQVQLKVVAGTWPAELKMLIATAIAVAFSLLSFEVFIRRWPLADLLATSREFLKASKRDLQSVNQNSSGGLQSCQGGSSIGPSLRPWPASSSASTP